MDTTITNASNASNADNVTLSDYVPSLCIPRVYTNINEGIIRKIINDLGLGVIECIDIVSKTTEKGEKYNRVFIHMERWFQNSNASFARERLFGGKDIKIIYDDPWFWKVSAYKNSEGGGNRKKPTNHIGYTSYELSESIIKNYRWKDEERKQIPPNVRPFYTFEQLKRHKCRSSFCCAKKET